MPIKSLDELKRIREEHQKRIGLRTTYEGSENKTEVLIGMATCGISSGARETMNAFASELEKLNIDNVNIIPVGCIGYCHSEPTVQINVPGKEPILYGNVKKEVVPEIVEKHIKGGKPVDQYKLRIDFDRV